MKITDTIGRAVSIERTGPAAWELTQRVITGKNDNAQNPTWVKIDNPGEERTIELRLFWAETRWPHYRGFAYQKIGDDLTAVRGEIDGDSTVWRLEIPAAVSWFGAFPWYSNEDADAFLAAAQEDPLCRVRAIGRSGRGREIKCLTIGPKGASENVVVLARMHATETPGSFAVEGIADFLLTTGPGKRLSKKRTFHLFPNVNPDGVAAGLKLTRRGARNKYDMAAVTMAAEDRSMVTLRKEIARLRPAALLDIHSYLPPMTGLFFFDDRLGLAVLREMLRDREEEAGFYFRAMNPDNEIHAPTLWSHCFAEYRTAVAVAEISWSFGRVPADIGRDGVRIFHALMKAARPR